MKCEKCNNEYSSQYYFVNDRICKNCFESLSEEEKLKITNEMQIENPYHPFDYRATFGIRFAAALIDYVILFILMMIVFSTTGFFDAAEQLSDQFFALLNNPGALEKLIENFLSENVASLYLANILPMAYFFLEIMIGASLGKLILGLKIGSADRTAASSALLTKRFLYKTSTYSLSVLFLMTNIGIFNTFSGIFGLAVFIGFFLILGHRRQALHDRLAGTAIFRKTDI